MIYHTLYTFLTPKKPKSYVIEGFRSKKNLALFSQIDSVRMRVKLRNTPYNNVYGYLLNNFNFMSAHKLVPSKHFPKYLKLLTSSRKQTSQGGVGDKGRANAILSGAFDGSVRRRFSRRPRGRGRGERRRPPFPRSAATPMRAACHSSLS